MPMMLENLRCGRMSAGLGLCGNTRLNLVMLATCGNITARVEGAADAHDAADAGRPCGLRWNLWQLMRMMLENLGLVLEFWSTWRLMLAMLAGLRLEMLEHVRADFVSSRGVHGG